MFGHHANRVADDLEKTAAEPEHVLLALLADLEIPLPEQPTITYSAALLERAHSSAPAAQFMAMLGGPEARQRLVAAGFVPLAEKPGRTRP